MKTDTRADAYRRALAAEPGLKRLDHMVRLLAATAPKRKPFCCGCIWERILKPLASPLVGWTRGYPQEQASDPDADGTTGFEFVSMAEVLERMDERPAPSTDTEAWLRSTEAWDAVTDTWLELLDDADPGLGHGFPGQAYR